MTKCRSPFQMKYLLISQQYSLNLRQAALDSRSKQLAGKTRDHPQVIYNPNTQKLTFFLTAVTILVRPDYCSRYRCPEGTGHRYEIRHLSSLNPNFSFLSFNTGNLDGAGDIVKSMT